MANRTTFIVDGFNLYHSAKAAARFLARREGRPESDERGTKWLDIPSLLSAYLYHFGKDARLERIYYFSAYAHHMETTRPGTVQRHETYVRCLEDSGVSVEMSRFKRKDMTCPICKRQYLANEEKETDVAIAAKLLEILHLSDCDRVVLLTGDTDLIPAVKTAQRLFPQCRIHFIFPWKRKNKELAKLAPGSIRISLDSYARHQFPDPLRLTRRLLSLKTFSLVS